MSLQYGDNQDPPYAERSTLADWRKRTDEALRVHAVARLRLRTERDALSLAQARLTATQDARQIAQTAAQAVQSRAYERIAGVVTKCLEAVFDEPYTLRMSFEQRRGRTEVDLSFERDGLLVDPLTASGGGVVDVASFALRLAALVMSRPQLRRLLVLDEPFRFLSTDYRPRVRLMLETLATEMGVQMILVTHSDELKTGKVIEL